MTQYFFDIVGQSQSIYDYSGRFLSTPEKAYELAELMAFDLAVTSEEERLGWAINVHTAEGHKIFSVAVHSSCLAAA